MNVFDAVKSSVTTRQAAEHYGVHVNRYGMACCPFHHDRTPSMKLDRRYHCFGCGADGNVIDFASGFLGISSTEAAMKLAQDFGVTYEYRGRSRDRPIKTMTKEPVQEKQSVMDELRMWRILCDYLHLLQKWKTEYAPQPEDEDWHPLFCEALSKITIVEYYLDILMDGSDDERAFFIQSFLDSPSKAQLQRVCEEIKDEQRNGRGLPTPGRAEGYGVCEDAGGGEKNCYTVGRN